MSKAKKDELWTWTNKALACLFVALVWGIGFISHDLSHDLFGRGNTEIVWDHDAYWNKIITLQSKLFLAECDLRSTERELEAALEDNTRLIAGKATQTWKDAEQTYREALNSCVPSDYDFYPLETVKEKLDDLDKRAKTLEPQPNF